MPLLPQYYVPQQFRAEDLTAFGAKLNEPHSTHSEKDLGFDPTDRLGGCEIRRLYSLLLFSEIAVKRQE